jgi:hypothetical protein
MISYVLVFIGAFFNACMDITEEETHFNKSIFKNLDPRFFCKSISWQYAKTILKVHFDFWHLCKFGWIFSMLGAIVIFRIHHQWWVHYISLLAIWWITFELFYGKILKVK